MAEAGRDFLLDPYAWGTDPGAQAAVTHLSHPGRRPGDALEQAWDVRVPPTFPDPVDLPPLAAPERAPLQRAMGPLRALHLCRSDQGSQGRFRLVPAATPNRSRRAAAEA